MNFSTVNVITRMKSVKCVFDKFYFTIFDKILLYRIFNNDR